MLAMILAVAMSVTMVPQTVFAAPADDTAVGDIVDAAAEKSDADIPADGNVSEDGAEQKDAGDVVSDGTAADDAGGDASDTGVVKDSDGSADAANTTGNDATIGGDVENTDQEPTDGGNTEIKAEPNAEGDTSAVTYEISIDGMETEAVYDGYAPFDTSLAVLKKTENGKTTVVDEETPTAAWKVKGADGNFTALTGVPVNVGEYELTLTCAAVADVHDALTETVTCEIKKAPLTIKATANAKPGDKADKANVTVTVNDVIAAEGDPFNWTTNVIALEVTGIREAYGSSLKADETLKQDGDYVVDVTPSLKADAVDAAKEAAKNYKLEAFTADVVMAELTKTQIVVTLADRWKELGEVTLNVYDGKPADAPAVTTDYTCVVQYWDETTGWKDLEGAVAVGGWKEYEGCKKKEDGTVEPPADAGTYYYGFTYEDKTGVYAESATDSGDSIQVEIKPATVTVGITNTAEIKVPVDTVMTKVLSQVKYEAKTVDRAEKPVTIKPAENHIWGTGYDDSNVSQIYEPAFTLQVKDGQTWKSISDANYRMEGGKEYRVIYDGKKAIYNADGTYAHRTGINSGLDENGEEINGVNANYTTDETATTDDKALTVTVEPGVEMDWDLEALLKDGKAGATPETATAKEYDNTPLYANRSDYKNKIKLKGTDSSKTLNAVGGDFTYTWYENDAEDLLDKEILDQNQANGFTSYGFEDGWNELGNTVAPTRAGIYKLKIEYEDNTDDGTFYYVKDERPAEVYFVINKVQLTITPEGEYSTLSGGTAVDFFNNNEIKYQMLDKDGKPYTAPKGVEQLKPYWNILEHTKQDGSEQVNTSVYEEDDDYSILVSDANTTYEIQADAVKFWDGDYFNQNYNYTTSNSVKTEEDAVNAAGETKKRASRKEESLSGKVGLKVNPMGTTVLTITPTNTPAELTKTFDGEVFPEQERNQKIKSAYTLTKTENGQQVPVEEDPGVRYLCVNKTDTDDECMLEDLSNAGEYNLYACFWDNETYAPLDLGPEPVTVPGVLIGTVKIDKRQVTLQLKVDDTYQAGSIRWEDGYVETYKLKFTEATKLGNLKEAVAPKSLAFNAPNKKMAVGESQQLDVKITKVQMGDVICLGYTSDNPQTLTVNENGSVTALKIGSATIKVFPQRYVKGKLEPIPNAKAATVKIQVTKLTAPKKVTSTVRSTFVDLNYDTPIDGYRREIYVAKKNNSLKTAAQFENILKGMKESQWKEHFVIEPVYLDGADESLNRRKGYTVQLSGLDANTDYTVYVRNTCAARTLEDGSVITKAAVDESAAGTVVNVKTRKIEFVGIDFYVFASGGWDYDEYGNHRILWLSKVKNRTVQCTPYAYFPAIGADPAADESDRVRIAIPFKGEDKKKYKDIYEEPKFEYALKFADESSDKYATKNKAASIDKNGKIKFTGIPGEDNPLVVRMRDTVTGATRYASFSFRDEADSVVAAKKSVTLSVGQTQNLGELLTYKLGNTKLTCYGSQWLDMDAVRSAIKTQKQEQYFRVSNGGYLTAIKQGGSLNLQLTDKNVEKLSGKEKATAAVTIKSTDLTAIKKLKAYDTIHDRFGLQFTYAGYADEFLLEISDAKKPICSKVVSYDDGINGVTQAFKRDKNGYYLYDKDGSYIPLKDTYEISPTAIKSMVGLVKETQYTVKLTPIYRDVKAKTATTKVKTTKIPAMNTWLTNATARGGMGIKLSESDFYGTTLSVLSGNSYTLTAKPDNNRGRVNDTLIWKVGNAKVASVKAAAGTYCITLKGLKPGYTTLEVRSKILGNKVIARYDINVVAVGDAYKNGVIRYYGDNEPSSPGTPSAPGQIRDGEPVYLPLSVDDPRKVTVNQTESFSFTAPETGRYRIQAIKRSGLNVNFRMTSYPNNSGTNSLDLGWIQAGKGNSVNLTSYAGYSTYADTSYYIEVTLEQAVEEVSVGEKTVEIEDNNYSSQKAYFCFTAPEDGEYSFNITKASQYGTTPYLYLYENEEEAFAQNGSSLASGSGSVSYTMTGGTSIWVRADRLYFSYAPYTLMIEKVSTQPTP